MRQQRNPMRNIAWKSWVERIDGNALVIVATAEETYRGGIYRAGTFLLVPPDMPLYKAFEQAGEKLRQEMRDGVHREYVIQHGTLIGYMHRFGMPLREHVRDLRR